MTRDTPSFPGGGEMDYYSYHLGDYSPSATFDAYQLTPPAYEGPPAASYYQYCFQLELSMRTSTCFLVKARAGYHLNPDTRARIGRIDGLRPEKESAAVVPNAWIADVSHYQRIVEELRCIPRCQDIAEIPTWVLHVFCGGSKGGVSGRSPPDSVREADIPLLAATNPLGRALMPFQREGVVFGVGRRGRCLIGDEMGLGKTLQALAIAAHFASWPVLVLCPASIRFVWKEQTQQWLASFLEDFDPDDHVQVIASGTAKPLPDAKVVVVPYSLIQKPELQKTASGGDYQMVICDECHYVKNQNSMRSRATLPLIEKASRAVLLSGTPALNKAEELYTILASLGVLPGVTHETFCRRYCHKDFLSVRGGRIIERWVGVKHPDELNVLLTSTVMIRRKKIDVLSQLPKVRRHHIPLALSGMRSLARQCARLDKDTRGGRVGVLRDVGTSPAAFESAGSDSDSYSSSSGAAPKGKNWAARFRNLARRTGEAKLKAIREYITYLKETLLEEDSSRKILFFAHHHHVLDAIADHLAGLSILAVSIDGRTQQAARPQLVSQFQNESSVRAAVLSITACGEGITLTAADTVVFCELFWVPGSLEQAEARAHRIGQTSTHVDVHYLVAPQTVDERMFQALNQKKMYTSGILDGHARATTLNACLASADTSSVGDDSCDGGITIAPPPFKKPRVQQITETDAAEEEEVRGQSADCLASIFASLAGKMPALSLPKRAAPKRKGKKGKATRKRRKTGKKKTIKKPTKNKAANKE